uniref:SET domain-containing protein n=1 Tax=Ditylum brightwellii TaxID=49249 RepID=A0A6V2PQY7_9STRA|mmetsp:Transcript_17543/g.26130  ORF Transcript_17543/g.26130 Transcript_17543/m.26130 type:complete len:223 (+) Transcript_17543:208-876(+)
MTLTTLFDSVSSRLAYLEKWRELAIRPDVNECHEDDQDLLDEEGIDDLHQLSQRCLAIRKQMNSMLPPHELAMDNELTVRKSAVPNAGDGLFFEPSKCKDSHHVMDKDGIIPCGSIICYYTGHRHNFFSQKYLQDRSYLLNVSGDVLVDPKDLPQIKARYINDPLNEKLVNCKFVPDYEDCYRCKVVATRDIHSGEELFVSYGQNYWMQHKTPGTIYHGSRE